MLTGNRFKLEHVTVALGVSEGKREAVTIPTGAIVKVVSSPSGEGYGLVDVLWDGRAVTMFAVDVDIPGTEIAEQSATA